MFNSLLNKIGNSINDYASAEAEEICSHEIFAESKKIMKNVE